MLSGFISLSPSHSLSLSLSLSHTHTHRRTHTHTLKHAMRYNLYGRPAKTYSFLYYRPRRGNNPLPLVVDPVKTAETLGFEKPSFLYSRTEDPIQVRRPHGNQPNLICAESRWAENGIQIEIHLVQNRFRSKSIQVEIHLDRNPFRSKSIQIEIHLDRNTFRSKSIKTKSTELSGNQVLNISVLFKFFY